MSLVIVTIGIYGFEAEQFFQALRDAQVEVFCDVRDRRAVRGKRYAFANSVRLQQRLQDMNIRYVHLKELAPSAETRKVQAQEDKAQRQQKRKRERLSQAFIQAYEQTYLAGFQVHEFLAGLGGDPQVIALCCVERLPEACHRFLLAKRLEQDLALSVTHLLP